MMAPEVITIHPPDTATWPGGEPRSVRELADRTAHRAMSARLEGLFRRYHAQVARIALARTRTVHDAQDVAGETWARAAKSLPTLRGDDDHALAWLVTITHRAAIDFYRPKRSTERPMDWTEAAPSRLLPSERSAEDEALTNGAGQSCRTGHWYVVLTATARHTRYAGTDRAAALAALTRVAVRDHGEGFVLAGHPDGVLCGREAESLEIAADPCAARATGGRP